MKYKIGDKIKIRSDLIGDRRYDELYFPKEMEVYNGNSVIVTGITEDYTYKLTNISELEWDDLVLESWEWNDKMIEGIIKVVQEKESDMKEIKLADLLTTLINDPNFSHKYYIFIYEDGNFHPISEIDVYNMKIWCTDDYECTFSECEEYELWVK